MRCSHSWQAPRTEEQQPIFDAALKAINQVGPHHVIAVLHYVHAHEVLWTPRALAVQWYAHKGTTVWLVTAGKDRVNGLSYWDKGW